MSLSILTADVWQSSKQTRLSACRRRVASRRVEYFLAAGRAETAGGRGREEGAHLAGRFDAVRVR